jgi:hypothetical protein
MKKFTKKQTEKHLQLLADAFFKNLQIDNNEFGGIGLDCKRPFGNSSVESDICHILNLEYDYSQELDNYTHDLYFEKLIPYLQKKWSKK